MRSLENFVPALFVFDCDSTLIEQEVIELLAELAGSREEVARITQQAMEGKLDFEASLKERVATLRGLSTKVYKDVLQEITFTQGAKELIKKIHEIDGFVGIVSGGFKEILDPLATELGADFWLANELAEVEGQLTGEVLGDVVDSQTKATMLSRWAAAHQIPLANTVTVGDGANDIPMMKKSGISFAFNAKPVVQEVATFSIENDLLEVARILEF